MSPGVQPLTCYMHPYPLPCILAWWRWDKGRIFIQRGPLRGHGALNPSSSASSFLCRGHAGTRPNRDPPATRPRPVPRPTPCPPPPHSYILYRGAATTCCNLYILVGPPTSSSASFSHFGSTLRSAGPRRPRSGAARPPPRGPRRGPAQAALPEGRDAGGCAGGVWVGGHCAHP